MSFRYGFAVVIAVALAGGSRSTGAAPLAVVEKGRSSYVVYHEPEAPASVRLAATELQRILRLSTGVELPIVHTPRSPMTKP